MNDNIVVENTKFIAFRDAELTQVAQKELTHLYMPLVGQKSINIYIRRLKNFLIYLFSDFRKDSDFF